MSTGLVSIVSALLDIDYCLATSFDLGYRSSSGRLYKNLNINSQSQWPRGLRRRSAADRLLRLRVRIAGGMDFFGVLCVVR
jgi:hypothetical protein